MPKMDFNFHGSITGANITEATEVATGKTIDVRRMSGTELEQKLWDGELAISLGDYLYENRKNEVILEDFAPTVVWPEA